MMRKMASTLSRLFSETDLAGIADAVKRAETGTSGEIVPYVVEASDEYEESIWRAGFVGAILTLAPFALMRSVGDFWLPDPRTVIGIALTVSGLVMTLLWISPRLRVMLTSTDKRRQRVTTRAREAFLAEEVFKTRERTGILIFVSLMEHEVVVLGDSGINAKVNPSQWKEIAATVVRGMRMGKPADGLVQAIEKSGALLSTSGIARRSDDRDELPDALRTGV